MDGSNIIQILISTTIFIFIFILIVAEVLDLFNYNLRVGEARTVRIRDTGKICEPSLGEIPVIPEETCKTSDGRTVRCYKINDITFEISPTPFYYRSVCNRLCGEVNLNGVCEEDNSMYDFCLNLLEPPEGCLNSANPLGRLTDTNSIYYAKAVL